VDNVIQQHNLVTIPTDEINCSFTVRKMREHLNVILIRHMAGTCLVYQFSK
jgi:hypothetical protein